MQQKKKKCGFFYSADLLGLGLGANGGLEFAQLPLELVALLFLRKPLVGRSEAHLRATSYRNQSHTYQNEITSNEIMCGVYHVPEKKKKKRQIQIKSSAKREPFVNGTVEGPTEYQRVSKKKKNSEKQRRHALISGFCALTAVRGEAVALLEEGPTLLRPR